MEQFLRNDTIFPDSLKYTTKEGREVFGGGGIRPDVIIKRDTTLNYKIINTIIMKGWIRDFSMQYSDNNRNNIFEVTDSQEYLQRIEDIIYAQFINYLKKIDADISEEITIKEKIFLKKQITANIARNIWSNIDYYRIILDRDEYIIEALKNN